MSVVNIILLLALTTSCGRGDTLSRAMAMPIGQSSGFLPQDIPPSSSLSQEEESNSMESQSQSPTSPRDCGLALLRKVGKTGQDSEKLPDLYLKHSRRKDDLFLRYMFAVIYVESGFNRNARSPKDAYGLMQMTAVAVQDAQAYCKLRAVPDMAHLFDSVTNIRYGTCYLQKAIEELEGDWTAALIMYNGGYRQLTRYQKGESIVQETANYVLQVQRALAVCSSEQQ